MNLTNLSASQLRHAADLKEKIAALQNELSQYLGEAGSPSESLPATVRTKRKFRMSAAGRARIIAAQKARWAKVHASKGAKATAKPAKTGRRTMSPAARAKIAAIARARWAKVKASGKSAL